jgi:hypothetical protein
MSELAFSFTLKLNDQGSGPATRALAALTRALKETEGAAKSTSSNAISAFQKLASAREVLGIRAEKAIQNEIRQTEAAYQRLAQSGEASTREMARAQDAMRQKVAELRRELDGVRNSSGTAQAALGRVMGVVGAYQAGKMIIGQPIAQTMAYDRQLAHLSNTAFAGQSIDARRTGMRSLDAAIVQAVRQGGGTREGALGALDKLYASGAYSDDPAAALRVLPVLAKAGTAAHADPTMLADIAIRGRQTFSLNDPARAIDQAMKAGQLGGFELKDMAKWLPSQMAMARQSGLRGEEGFKVLLAANQAAAITAGSKDEAGNNLVNLLQKINSQDTANDAKKLGIDLPGTLAAARAKGVNSLDAFVNMTEQIVGRDKRFGLLREQARNATGDERRAAYESMGDIVQGSAIGKIVQDRQALMGLLGIMNNRGYMNDIRGQLDSAKGTTDDAFALISGTPSYQAEQLAAEKAIAMQTALDKVNPGLGSMAEGLTGVMREWPGFSAAIVASTTALTALAAAAAAAGLASVLSGGKGGAILGGAGRMLAGAGSAAGGALLSGAAFGVATAGAGGYAAGSMINGGINKADAAFGTEIGNDIGRLVAFVMAGLGSKEAKDALQIEIDVKNGNIVAEVNRNNAQEASRH